MKKKRLDYSLFSLLIVNIVIIIFAIIYSWNFGLLIWIYFFQSVIIGIFSFFRILNLKNYSTEGFRINNAPVKPNKSTKRFSAFFFLFHYGFFHAVYFVFLIAFYLDFLLQNLLIILISSLTFAANHCFSYFYNRKKDLQIKENIGSVMFKPYRRIFPMHIVIIFGSILNAATLTPFFLILKTIFDGLTHRNKHGPNKFQK
jgi:hypothetical protein